MKTRFALPAFLFLLPASLFAQGPLPPPAGAPVPTMKSLDQIEPRVVLPGGTSTVTIDQPGSYRLAGNIAVSAGNGIEINADNVALDLGGFTISSTASPNDGEGITLLGERTNVVIENGGIASGVVYQGGGVFSGPGFNNGITAVSALSAVRVTKVNVRGVLMTAINLGTGSNTVVQGCVVDTASAYGIRAGTVSDSSAFRIGTGGPAIQADSVANSTGTLTDGSLAPVITSNSPSTASVSAQITSLSGTVGASANPRTPIPAGAGTFTITTSGSYLLAGERTGPAGAAAISVNAPDVTIDLNGFTITGASATALGVRTTANARRLVVRNGTITGCISAVGSLVAGLEVLRVENVRALDCTGAIIQGPPSPGTSYVGDCTIRGVAGNTHGINLGPNSTVRNTQVTVVSNIGIYAENNSTILDCRVTGGTNEGIHVGTGSVIDRCQVTGMTNGNAAIYADSGSRIANSAARSNTVRAGIYAFFRCSVTHCVASGNTYGAVSSEGIHAEGDSTVIGCVASNNTSTNATLNQETGTGIFSRSSNLVRDCTCQSNTGAGIRVDSLSGSSILENVVSFNGVTPGVGAGITVSNTTLRCRIEGNTANFNKTGILLPSGATGNIVLRNVAGGNTVLNWNISAGNSVAPVVLATVTAAFSGNTGGGALGSTDPNANFTLP